MKAHSYFYATLQLHCEMNHNIFTVKKSYQADSK